jgi:hypothetical protein
MFSDMKNQGVHLLVQPAQTLNPMTRLEIKPIVSKPNVLLNPVYVKQTFAKSSVLVEKLTQPI